MKHYKIVHKKPFIPRGFGKRRRKKLHVDFGAIGEAAFIVLLVAAFLYACFVGIPL